MVKTNAERQAEYRLRQHGLGEKKRLNIWLSTHAHKELSVLAKRNGMSKQVLIEWLLTNDPLQKEQAASSEKSVMVALTNKAEKLPRNDSQEENTEKKRVKTERSGTLLRNLVPKVGSRRSEEQSDLLAEKAPSSPVPAQLELQL